MQASLNPLYKLFFRISIYVLLLSFNIFICHAQHFAIGDWKSYTSYLRNQSVASDGSTLFVGGQYSFFTYNIINKETTLYSKNNGMSDIGIAHIAYDPLNNTTIIAYNNSNIDLFTNNNFYNIPYLKLKNSVGDKKIYNVYTRGGLAYLSTGVGLIIINTAKKEIKETVTFYKNGSQVNMYSFTADDLYFYAATSVGIYRIAQSNPNIQINTQWILIDSSRSFSQSANNNNTLFFSTEDSIFTYSSDNIHFAYTKAGYKVQHIDSTSKGLSVCLFNPSIGGKVYFLNSLISIVDSTKASNPYQCIVSNDNTSWVADAYEGLISGNERIVPNSPYEATTYDILSQNNQIVLAHGSYNDKWDVQYNPNGVSVYNDMQWQWYNRFTNSQLQHLTDAIKLATDPSDGTIYIASQTDGLFYIKKDNSVGQIKEGVFEQHIIDPSTYRISGIAFDDNNNLWVTQTNAPHELMVRLASNNSWYKFALYSTRPRPVNENGAAGLIIDQNNLKWFFSPGGGGVLIYNDNNTIENPNDDTYTKLTAGKGFGNLPDNNVNCIVNDKNNTIWIGTNNGIGIINCPNKVISRECEAEIRVVQYDNSAGELFAGEMVKSIAVDGANRKWVGTNNGVWLISEDASKILMRFTVDNSPLPSNLINIIKIDAQTGEVFFGTNDGMVSYRGSATEGGEKNNNVKIFPNPVEHTYNGTIAISGLVENADIRICDVSGQLVYKTKALGGQAIWSGKDYTGRRPQSGVYLIFATNREGNETFAGKIVFIN